MSYKLRNTLILSLVLVVLIAASIYFVFVKNPEQIENLQVEIRDIQAAIAQLDEREAHLAELHQVTEEKKQKLATLDKTITQDVTLSEVLSYLDDIQDLYGSVTFSLRPKDKQSSGDYGYLRFTLKGEGSFERIFRLIWALERGPRVFIVESMSLRGVETMNTEEKRVEVVVPFEIQVRAPYANVPDLPPLQRTLADVRVPDWNSNLFYPLIRKQLPPNPGLLEVERAELRAILPDKVLISDYSGKLHELQIGDPVYMGYLTTVDAENNTVTFTLNKGGLVERFVLELGEKVENT